MRLLTLAASGLILMSSLPAADTAQLEAAAKKIAEQQQRLSDEVQELLRLLGLESTLSSLKLISAPTDANSSVKTATAQGIKEYQQKRYEEAKESFQKAWEDAPNTAFANFNLGMAYHRLGKGALSKRMLKAALDADGSLTGSDKIKAYLEGKEFERDIDEAEETKDIDEAKTKLTNLKKRVDSYLGAKSMPFPKRMNQAVHQLNRMVEIAGEHDKLVEDYYLEIADNFAAFEMFDKAKDLYGAYEKSMKGKVLPDGYHASLLDLQEKSKQLDQVLEDYVDNTPDKEVSRKLNRDLKELEIFATQIDNFVKTLDNEDVDFSKVCQRLKDYRWGDKTNRHVVIASRYLELLYSTLPGTLSLDRYVDENGERFFKNITLLADRLKDSHAEFVDVDLSVNGIKVPYTVMYSYIPAHEAFIIVRLPKRDLS